MPTKFFDGAQLKSLSLTNPESWIDAGFGDWFSGQNTSRITAESSYSAVGWLRRCVDVRAAALAALPWSLYRGDTLIVDSNDDAPDNMRWLETLPVMLARTEAAMAITSTAYWFKVQNRGRAISELRWFAPDTMTPRWDKSTGLVGFERKLGSDTYDFAPEAIVYFRYPNPLHETEPGASPVQSALADIGVLHSYTAFAKAYFDRGAIRPMLLTYETKLTPSDEEKVVNWWNRVFSGLSNAFNTEVFAKGIKPEIVGDGIGDLSNVELSAEKREAISTALGVPHSIVMSNAANFATAEADRLNFYDMTILPEARIIEQALNRQLFDAMGYRLRFQPEAMSIYQENEEQRATALVQYVNAGFPLSVAAQLLGITLPEGMDYSELDPEPQPITIDATPQPEPTEPAAIADNSMDAPADDAQNARKSQAWEVEAGQFRKWLRSTKGRAERIDEFNAEHLTHDDKLAITIEIAGKAIRKDAERADLEEQHADKLARAFRRVLREVVPAGTTADNITPDIAAQRLQDNRQIIQDALVAMLRDAVMMGVQDGQEQVEKAMGVRKNVSLSVVWDQVSQIALAWLLGGADGFGDGYGNGLTTQIMRTSEQRIRDEIARWVEDRTPLRNLTDALESTAFSRSRAEMIAQTEATRAFAEGNRIAFRESGIVQRVRWNTARDELVCPICGPLDRQTAPIDETFDGGYFPPAHPRCRCDISPVIEVPR